MAYDLNFPIDVIMIDWHLDWSIRSVHIFAANGRFHLIRAGYGNKRSKKPASEWQKKRLQKCLTVAKTMPEAATGTLYQSYHCWLRYRHRQQMSGWIRQQNRFWKGINASGYVEFGAEGLISHIKSIGLYNSGPKSDSHGGNIDSWSSWGCAENRDAGSPARCWSQNRQRGIERSFWPSDHRRWHIFSG